MCSQYEIDLSGTPNAYKLTKLVKILKASLERPNIFYAVKRNDIRRWSKYSHQKNELTQKNEMLKTIFMHMKMNDYLFSH